MSENDKIRTNKKGNIITYITLVRIFITLVLNNIIFVESDKRNKSRGPK